MERKKNILWSVLGVIAILVIVVLIWLFATGILGLDHSGERRGDDLYWNDVRYVMCSGYGEYKEGKTIAKTSDGFRINEVEGDKDHTYVVLRSFLDQQLYVKEEYLKNE